MIWFVHENFPADMSKVTEVFIDATYSTSQTNTHFYAIVTQENGDSVILALMLMEIHCKEDTKSRAHEHEALQCNKNFYEAAKSRGLTPRFVHTDKDFCEISAAQVCFPQLFQFRAKCCIQVCFQSWGDLRGVALDIESCRSIDFCRFRMA